MTSSETFAPASPADNEPRYLELIEEIRRCEFRTLLAEIEKEAAAAAKVSIPRSLSRPRCSSWRASA